MSYENYILTDPTGTLTRALDPNVNSDHRLVLFLALHHHKLGGGAVPAQERGEGTAVGRIIEELQGNAYIFHINSCSTASDAAETDWRELKQDTEAALRAVTGEG